MATIIDVAKLANVSVSTVSRCMNNSGYVSDETVKKVKEAAEKLNYIPNIGMRLLKSNYSRIIALFIPTLNNSFFVELATLIDRECVERDYKLIVCNIDGNINKEASYLDMIARMKVDGVIIATGTSISLRLSNIPIVILDRYSNSNENALFVNTDNLSGAIQATKHLIENGCKNIAFVQSIYQNYSQLTRLKGFNQVVKEHRINSAIMVYDEKSELENMDFSNFDGIFAWNDDSAIQLMFSLLKKGYRIPDDIQIVGFDDLHLSSLVYPQLTTIHQDLNELSKKTVGLLIDKIENKIVENNRVVLPAKLIVRNTTRRKNE